MSKRAPNPSRRSLPCLLIAGLAAASGLVNVLASMGPKSMAVVEWMEQWVPFEVSQGSRLLLFFFGVLQLAVSRGLARGKKAAWLISLVALVFAAILHLGSAVDWHHSLWSLALIGVLLWRHRDFHALSDAPSIRWAAGGGSLALAAWFLFAFAAVWRHAPEAGLERTASRVAPAAFGLMFFQDLDVEGVHANHAMTSFIEVQAGSLLLFSGIFFFALRPVIARTGAGEEERERARRLIAERGADPMDDFALMPDKRYFFHGPPVGESVIPYALWRDVAVALAGPIGPPEKAAEVMRAFHAFSAAQDWIPCFYCCPEHFKSAWQTGPWRGFQIAEDARLPLENFTMKGSAFQNLRTLFNKARKESQQFRFYSGEPFDYGLEAQMKALSDEWLASKGGTEMSFDLGAYSTEEIRRNGVTVVFDSAGKLLAFATWQPYAQGRGRCIDLMRTMTQGAMDYLILESVEMFRAQGVTEISLGNSPLAHAEPVKSEDAQVADRVVHYLYENFNRIYGYKSLFEFKKKYRPEWSGRYLVYDSNADLPAIMAAVVRTHVPRGLWKMVFS